MVGLKLYVEGGGNTNFLRSACRHGFSEFLKKAGLDGHMPRIVACGGRQDAYDAFCIARRNGEPAMLLVDSEASVAGAQLPWQHLLNRPGDKWAQPAETNNEHCHLMVQCMEAWLLADRQTLQKFFGQGFNEAKANKAICPAIATVPSSRWWMLQ